MKRKNRANGPGDPQPQPAPVQSETPARAADIKSKSRRELRAALLIGLQGAVAAFFYAWGLSSGRGEPAVAEPAPTSELDRILALPDAELEKVPITRINLLVAEELLPDLDVNEYQRQIQHLAREVKDFNAKHAINPKDPDQLIRALNTYLYFEKKFRYAKLGDVNDVVALHSDPRNLFLNGIMDRMMGTCISMPVLYIALGEELGYPIKGVNANDHFFCRWVGNGYVSNIEATNGGEEFTDEFYKKDLGITDEQIASGAYLRTLSKRDLIGDFFFARASHYSVTKQMEKTVADLQRVVACNPREVDGYANLAILNARMARRFGKTVNLVKDFPELFPPQVPIAGARVPLPIPGTTHPHAPRAPDGVLSSLHVYPTRRSLFPILGGIYRNQEERDEEVSLCGHPRSPPLPDRRHL